MNKIKPFLFIPPVVSFVLGVIGAVLYSFFPFTLMIPSLISLGLAILNLIGLFISSLSVSILGHSSPIRIYLCKYGICLLIASVGTIISVAVVFAFFPLNNLILSSMLIALWGIFSMLNLIYISCFLASIVNSPCCSLKNRY